MKKRIKLLLLIHILIVPVFQFISADKIIIKEITFYGCKHSSPDNLQKIIEVKEGDVFTAKLPEFIKDKLLMLEIFKTVEVEQRLVNDHVVLIISVVERSLFTPQLDVEFNTLDPDFLAEEHYNSFFGIGLKSTDYSGGRKVFHLAGGIGGQDRITLGFDKTTTKGSQYGIQVGYNHYDSRLGLDDRIEKGWLKLHFNQKWQHIKLKWWGEFDRMQVDTNGGTTIDGFWRTGIKADFDFCDNPLFPRGGIRLLLGGYRTWDNKQRLYDALDINLAVFNRGLNKFHAIALSLRSHLTEGQVPLPDKISKGGYLTLRGLKPYEDVFDQGVWGSFEYRIPIGNFNPSKTILFASSLYLFADAGLFADQIRDLKKSQFCHSAGLGFLWQIGLDGAVRFDLVLTPRVRFIVASGWKF